MNKKKKMNIKRPDLSESLSVLEKKCQPIFNQLLPFWQRLPTFHRKALTILAPVTLILILLPAGKKDLDSIQPTVIPTATLERKSISLNLEGLSQQPVTELQDKSDDPSELQVAPIQPSSSLHREKKQNEIKEKTVSVVKWHDYEIKNGDTLYQIFRTNGLPLAELNKIVKIEGAGKPLSNVKKGQLFRFKLNAQGELDIVQLEHSGQSVMYFRMSDGSFGRSK